MDKCEQCSIKKHIIGTPTIVKIPDNTEVLIVLDYPSIEDAGAVFFDNLNKRTTTVKNIISGSEAKDYKVSYAPIISCVTKSKSLLNNVVYEECFEDLKDKIINSNIKAIISFGIVAGNLITGNKFKAINETRRKNPYPTIFGDIKCIVTYTVDIMVTTQCGGCGKSVYPFLAMKDIDNIKNII